MLSKQVGARLLVCCPEETRDAFQKELKINKSFVMWLTGLSRTWKIFLYWQERSAVTILL
ncbi:MAG: hypothetical protein WDO16_21075 [Bacteroidota bacterium]